jgi:hypothetical protein
MNKVITAIFLLGILSGTETTATSTAPPSEIEHFNLGFDQPEKMSDEDKPHEKSDEKNDVKCSNFGSC